MGKFKTSNKLTYLMKEITDVMEKPLGVSTKDWELFLIAQKKTEGILTLTQFFEERKKALSRPGTNGVYSVSMNLTYDEFIEHSREMAMFVQA